MKLLLYTDIICIKDLTTILYYVKEYYEEYLFNNLLSLLHALVGLDYIHF
jgi:hypothetical protein